MKNLSKVIFPTLVIVHVVFRLVFTPLFAHEQQCAGDVICDMQEQLWLAQESNVEAPILASVE